MITENESLNGATRVRLTEPVRRPDTRTLGDIIAETQTDVSNIVRKEIQLAKAEIKVDVAKAGKGIGMFAGAAVFGIFGLNMLLFTLAWVLDDFMPRSLAFGIVTLVLFLAAGVLALVGKKAISAVNPKPERTIRNAQETVQVVKDGVSNR